MGNGIGHGKTREDHKNVSDQLYGAYAKAQDAKSLSAIVGAEALSESFVLDAPLFSKKIIIEKAKTEWNGSTGRYMIEQAHLEDK